MVIPYCDLAYRACRMDSVTNSDVSEGIGTEEREYGKQEDWADTTEAYKTSRYIPLLQLLRKILGPLGWEIGQANFTVGVWGSIPESRFDKSLTALGVPRSKFNSIHAECSRAALDMHEFMLQCRVYVCVSMLQRCMWAGVHMRT